MSTIVDFFSDINGYFVRTDDGRIFYKREILSERWIEIPPPASTKPLESGVLKAESVKDKKKAEKAKIEKEIWG